MAGPLVLAEPPRPVARAMVWLVALVFAGCAALMLNAAIAPAAGPNNDAGGLTFMAVLLLAATFGLLPWTYPCAARLEVDPAARRATYRRGRMFLPPATDTAAFADVADVVPLRVETRTSERWGVELELKDGRRWELCPLAGVADAKAAEAAAWQVHEALGLPKG